MDEKKNVDTNAEQRILDAAREVFAEKGYDAASISEIAKRANVNKALPFYYFESKSKLLEAVVKQNAGQIMEFRRKFFEGVAPITKGHIDDFYGEVFKIFRQRKNTVSIVMAESLKGTPGTISIFEILKPLFDGMKELKASSGIKVKDEVGMTTASFFLSTIPILMFSALGDKWAEFNNYDINEVEEKFMKYFRQSFNELNFDFVEREEEKE